MDDCFQLILLLANFEHFYRSQQASCIYQTWRWPFNCLEDEITAWTLCNSPYNFLGTQGSWISTQNILRINISSSLSILSESGGLEKEVHIDFMKDNDTKNNLQFSWCFVILSCNLWPDKSKKIEDSILKLVTLHLNSNANWFFLRII